MTTCVCPVGTCLASVGGLNVGRISTTSDILCRACAPTPLGSLLADRGRRYGEFKTHAEVTQNLKRVMQEHVGWGRLADDQKEALEMVAHKVGRILNGDPNYDDSWVDIAGYVQLVVQRLQVAP